MYYNLIKEMREVQAEGSDKKADWISWHEGAHLISHAPQGCPMFQDIQDKLAGYFDIAQQSVGTRFNWYKDSSDWKPFHHDSAAFNPQRARNQNITVGVSFGATRELAFLSAATGEKIYFPQVNGMLFAFGRDVNIKWKHGVNALPQEEHDGKGRISIILWGLVPDVKEEDNSPPILTDNTRGNGYTMHRDRAPLERRDNYRRRSRSPRDRYRDNRRDRDHGRGGRPHCKFGNDCRDRQHGRCNR